MRLLSWLVAIGIAALVGAAMAAQASLVAALLRLDGLGLPMLIAPSSAAPLTTFALAAGGLTWALRPGPPTRAPRGSGGLRRARRWCRGVEA